MAKNDTDTPSRGKRQVPVVEVHRDTRTGAFTSVSSGGFSTRVMNRDSFDRALERASETMRQVTRTTPSKG